MIFRAVVAAAWIALLGGPLAAAESFPEPVASYSIEATLDPDSHRIRGRQTLTWTSQSTEPVDELWFHLYLNAFKNSRSTYLRHDDGWQLGRLADEGWGWIEISRIDLGGQPLAPTLTYRAPDDGNLEDRTVATVQLPEPVEPGSTLQLEIDFEAQLPAVVSRTGFAGDFHLVAQWFPKIGVLAEDGRWSCHQFHPASEFFADFGDYDVRLTLPEDFVVGATGERVSETRNGDGTRTLHYRQRGVHDFAWTAWPGFEVVERRLEPEGLPAVEVTLLLRPEARRLSERYFTALEHGLRLFGSGYGPYPYRTLTVVDPPRSAREAGGMEYPTFFTTGSRFSSPLATLDPEDVTLHELGHQFFHGIVATDEFEEPYLDEGIATYAAGRVLREAYGPRAWSYRIWGLDRSWPSVRQRHVVDTAIRFLRRPTVDPINRTAWGYLDTSAYGSLAYGKMALFLEQIERTVGSRAMEQALGTFARRFRFAHPRTSDLEETLTRETGRDLSPWFEQLLRGSDRLDYAVTRVESEPLRAAEGVFGEGGERSVLFLGETEKGFESVVEVRRLGGVTLPVTVELTFADGRTERRRWDGQRRWVRYRIQGPRLVAAQVDPDFVHVLDTDRLNNSLRVRPDRRASRRWHQRVRFWIQNLLETAAALS